MREIEEVYGDIEWSSRVPIMDKDQLHDEIIETNRQRLALVELERSRALTEDETKEKERLVAYLEELTTEYSTR